MYDVELGLTPHLKIALAAVLYCFHYCSCFDLKWLEMLFLASEWFLELTCPLKAPKRAIGQKESGQTDLGQSQTGQTDIGRNVTGQTDVGR